MNVGFGNKAKSSLSTGKKTMVCGYEIKKMPIGAYLEALECVESLPGDIMERCFPGKTLAEALDEAAKADGDQVAGMISRIVMAMPEYAIEVLSKLTKIPAKELREDDNIGVDGLMAIIDAVIEVNRLGEALSSAKTLLSKARIQIPSTGSKA